LTMSGKERRKNDNDKADDNPEDDGIVSLTPTLALTFPPAARNLLFTKGKTAPSWPNYE
jgi:hypothetical protein